LLLDALLRALADGDHGNDRTYADDDAKHGKKSSQLIALQGPQGDPK
jgi:hypothetical protein